MPMAPMLRQRGDSFEFRVEGLGFTPGNVKLSASIYDGANKSSRTLALRKPGGGWLVD